MMLITASNNVMWRQLVHISQPGSKGLHHGATFTVLGVILFQSDNQ